MTTEEEKADFLDFGRRSLELVLALLDTERAELKTLIAACPDPDGFGYLCRVPRSLAMACQAQWERAMRAAEAGG